MEKKKVNSAGIRKPKRTRNSIPPWSDLPSDILETIMQRLSYLGQICSQAVCKGWRVGNRIPSLKQLPWAMAFAHCADKNNTTCNLYDPSSKKSFRFTIEDEHLQGPLQFHACKQGWVLMSSDIENNPNSMFLFSPFLSPSTRFIDLPPLKSSFQVASFSTNPTDSDCVFFALDAPVKGTKVTINTYTRGDEKWTTSSFENTEPMDYGYCSVVYLEGTFYCLTQMGIMLGTYDVLQQRWCVFPRRSMICDAIRAHLVVSDGEVLLFGIRNCSPRLDVWTIPGRQIYKLHRSTMKWHSLNLHSSEARVFFLGGGSVSVPANVTGPKLERALSNQIFYSCEKDEGFKCKYFACGYGRRSYACTKYYGSLSSEKCKKLWMETPW